MELHLKEEHRVEFGEVDFKERLTLNGIIYYMQQVAANHALKLNFSYYKNEEKTSYFWIVARVKFIIDKYPKWQEQVAIETYPGGHDKLFAVRLFDLTNVKGEKIGHIIGDYILMDAKTNRPVKIKGAPAPLDILDFPYKGETLEKIQVPTTFEKEDFRKVRYSELDVNEHMNNAQHVRWAVDMLPIEIFEHKEIATLQINYTTGIEYGTSVWMRLHYDEQGEVVIWATNREDTIQYFIVKLTLRNL
ncbi:acyl-[acyl-carrier-protein] thioesterase [Sporanaerobium hydrogeniformans]|uniref:acyl-[acyl-carrier-protein] thioesterase n=1 Tax=Sporanaerobium hydrogeniformans TaxID=3072179 RepID=UPI0015D4F390|nr:acyl-ACP thioesterase domain-containing protein [Sporanaerobium hydrogeniformans]